MISVQRTTLFLFLALSPLTVFCQEPIALSSILNLEKGKIIGRKFVYVAEELQLTCVLEKNEFTANEIAFKFYYPLETSEQRECISQQYVHVVNDTTAELSVPNISRAGRAEYSCLVVHGLCNNNTSSDVWINAVDIIIQYRPQNVTNFTCEVFNFDENMTCTWQHPVPYDEKLNDTYVVGCPNPSFNRCFWNNVNGNLLFSIEVNVTNKNTKDVASQTFISNTSQNVKPAPVTDLVITNTTDQYKYLLSWKPKRNRTFIFQVFHKLQEDEDFKTIAMNITETNHTFELRPNTNHAFFVQSYPGGGYSGYWSDKTFYSYHTPEQPPSLGPETTNGSYSDLTGSCVDHHDRRKLMVFWKDVNESARNGVITKYVVKHEGHILTEVDRNSYSATVNISCHKVPVDLQITAVNSAGESTIPSNVRLAPYSVQVKETFAIEWNGTSVKAFWNVGDEKINSSYTVFWCIEDTESPCKGPIFWKHVPGSQSYLNIPELPSKTIDYHFGLAMRDDETVSGIQWTDCLFDPKPCKKNFMGRF